MIYQRLSSAYDSYGSVTGGGIVWRGLENFCIGCYSTAHRALQVVRNNLRGPGVTTK